MKLSAEPSALRVSAKNTVRNPFSPYCSLSPPNTVVYMPQISTHKHHSLDRSSCVCLGSLPTDYAWLMWCETCGHDKLRTKQVKDLGLVKINRGYYALVKDILLKNNKFFHFIRSLVFLTLSFIFAALALAYNFILLFFFCLVDFFFKIAKTYLSLNEVWMFCDDKSPSERERWLWGSLSCSNL